MNEHLNEEKYQETKGKVNRIGSILLFVGIAMLVFGIAMAFIYQKITMGIFIVIGLAMVGIGAQAKMISHQREITAFMLQQQMPIVQEGMEKMAPKMAKVAKDVAPAYGEAAKEIAKGIKEGLNEADRK